MKRLLFAVLMLCALACQAAVYSLPWGPKPQFVDANGAPMSSGSLLTFVGSSSTPQVTYTDSTGSVANPTTITLNTRGETPNEVWLTGGVLYKFVLKDSSGSTVWTVDNVSGVNDVTAAIDEWISGPAPTFVSATSFTLAGDQTTTFQVGRRVKTTNSGGTVYSTITASVFGASTTVTVANDSSTLDSGLSAVSVGIIRATNPSISPDHVHRKGTAVASAGTTNIWGIAGDYVHITGAIAITSFGTAPYAGAQRTVIFDGALTLTHNATTLQLPGGANITTAANDRAIVRADTTANMVVVDYVKAANAPSVGKQPTVTAVNSGTGTYTTPTGATRIWVRLVGAGGTGAGSGTGAGNGTTGGNTTFGTLTGNGGAAGSNAGASSGGTASGGDINISGGVGQGVSVTAQMPGGMGGGTPFGPGGPGGIGGANPGQPAAANTGAGGGGAGMAATAATGGGGAGGGYTEKLITGPSATYSYAIGAAGAVGTAGTSGAAGGAAGDGRIIIHEFYNYKSVNDECWLDGVGIQVSANDDHYQQRRLKDFGRVSACGR